MQRQQDAQCSPLEEVEQLRLGEGALLNAVCTQVCPAALVLRAVIRAQRDLARSTLCSGHSTAQTPPESASWSHAGDR